MAKPVAEGEDMARSEAERRTRPPVRVARVLRFGVSRMVRKDVELARMEIANKVKQAGIGAGMFGMAGIVGLLALGAFTAAAILGLSIVLPAWAASIIVAIAWAAIAGLLAITGKRNLQAGTPPVPSHTAEVVREDVRSLAGELKRGK